MELLRVSYSREEGTDLYRVRLVAFNQTIIVSRHILVKKIGMEPRVLVGCRDLPIYEILDLGFVLPYIDRRMVI